MGIDSAVQYLIVTLQVFFIDLLLSGDNAVVIALACRSLPDQQKRRAILAGTGIAILLRIVLTLIAGIVLQVPLLKLLGGIALTVIAVRLTRGDADHGGRSNTSRPAFADLGSVIATVVVADLVMSADNVVALAAVAKGSVAVLALGLLLSVPMLMFGSWHIAALLERSPVLIRLGGAMLGWIAGDIAVTDPLYAAWIDQQSPALHVVVPLLLAVYVLLQTRLVEQRRSSAQALRPVPRSRPPVAAPPSPLPVPMPVTTAEAPVPEVPVPEAPVDLPAHASDVDAPASSPRAGGRPRRWLAIGASTIAALGVFWGATHFGGMPAPSNGVHYECPGQNVSLDYRPGGQQMRLSSGVNHADGRVGYDNQIDWGDLHAASTTLGFVPPTRVLFGNAQSVRIDGGMFDDLTCRAR